MLVIPGLALELCVAAALGCGLSGKRAASSSADTGFARSAGKTDLPPAIELASCSIQIKYHSAFLHARSVAWGSLTLAAVGGRTNCSNSLASILNAGTGCTADAEISKLCQVQSLFQKLCKYGCACWRRIWSCHQATHPPPRPSCLQVLPNIRSQCNRSAGRVKHDSVSVHRSIAPSALFQNSLVARAHGFLELAPAC